MLFKVQSNEERRKMILNGKVINTLLFLSVPTLLVGIIQALIPLSDSLFLNRLTSVEVASSVTFSQPVLNIMLSLIHSDAADDKARVDFGGGPGREKKKHKQDSKKYMM